MQQFIASYYELDALEHTPSRLMACGVHTMLETVCLGEKCFFICSGEVLFRREKAPAHKHLTLKTYNALGFCVFFPLARKHLHIHKANHHCTHGPFKFKD